VSGRWDLYTAGYREAADRLVAGLKPEEMADGPGAALAYPILFCYRHYLELRLKALIDSVRLSLSYAGIEIDADRLQELETRAVKEHRLKALWEMLKRFYPACDAWATMQDRRAFEALLFEIEQHDAAGQAARYPVDVKGNQTLTGLSNVDMGIMKAGVDKIARYLDTTQEQFAAEMKALAEMHSCDEDSGDSDGDA
jgi:hypothetical protein